MNQSIVDERDPVLTEMSDNSLVLAARSGDCSAFGQLCERHSKKILPRLHRITGNWEDAEDVLQDSLIRAFVHLNGFEGRSSFSSWLTRIAINSALMLLRRRQRRLELPIDRGSGDCETAQCWELRDESETPEARYVRCEKEELLRSAIRRLPLCFRAVAELHHAHEYSPREIAEVLGISVSAAKTRLFRARMRMRAACSILP